MSKIVLAGANHAGVAAANTILAAGGHELVIYDRNTNISYLGCGTALWIGRQIESVDGLFYSSPDILREKGAEVYTETEVTAVDPNKKALTVRSKDGQESVASYDTLILATGSLPIRPKIPGSDLAGVQSVKLFQEGQEIDRLLSEERIESVAVVGAGYIGVELAEAIARRGKKALLFEAENTSIAGYYDPEFSALMDERLASLGVELHFGERIESITGDTSVTGVKTSGGEYGVQMVIMAIGFLPNAKLGGDAFRRFSNGAYLVDRRQQTSVPGVYAVGDCATVWSNAVGGPAYIALATNAVRSGIIAGSNAVGAPIESSGVQGSNGICVGGCRMVSTGLSLKSAKKMGFDADAVDWEDLQKPAFVTGENAKVKLRVVFDKVTRRILGAQMASEYDMSMGIHMFSLAVEQQMSVDRLALLDIFFLPHFNQPYNYITMAGLEALKK